MARLLSAALIAFLVAGCGEGAPGQGEADSGSDASGDSATSIAADPSGATVASSGADSATISLALEGEGLRVFVGPTGSARPMPFGSPMEAVTDMLTGALGGPPGEEGENADCAASYAGWENGLTVWSSDGRFVGWAVRDGDGTLATVAGAGVGSTRTEWESAYQLDVMNSSLGVEFTAGGMAGLFESAAPDALATHLWAGHVCIAR